MEKAVATHSSTLGWKSHGRRSLVDCSPWDRGVGHELSDFTFHFSLPCIGEGSGNPLQCSCLENPRDGGVWWAAVYGIAQSRTRLKRLSSSSSKLTNIKIFLPPPASTHLFVIFDIFTLYYKNLFLP